MASNYSLSPSYTGENDYDDDSLDLEDDSCLLDEASDEDTEDASETDEIKKTEHFTEIKEQMYQFKLAQFKKQLTQLKDSTLPEYLKKVKRLDHMKKERLRINDIWYKYMLEKTDEAFLDEQRMAADEFEEEKVKLKENLICEFEDKRTQMEAERHNLELSGDFQDIKQASTRKLRRRANDPTPVPEKRRKITPSQMCYGLDEEDILEDWRLLNKLSGKPMSNHSSQSPALQGGNKKAANSSSSSIVMAGTSPLTMIEARIHESRLYYDKKCFTRGQTVLVDSKDISKFNAVISALGTQEIWLRRTSDNSKVRITCLQLQKGKYTLKKRP